MEYLPGPHAASDSLTKNDTASQDELLRVDTALPLPEMTEYDCDAVPSNNIGPISEADGDCV